jgi:hypothetical protein
LQASYRRSFAKSKVADPLEHRKFQPPQTDPFVDNKRCVMNNFREEKEYKRKMRERVLGARSNFKSPAC